MAHPHTTALTNAADRMKGLAPHERAYMTWIAWMKFSSRSGANFAGLMLDANR